MVYSSFAIVFNSRAPPETRAVKGMNSLEKQTEKLLENDLKLLENDLETAAAESNTEEEQRQRPQQKGLTLGQRLIHV